MASLADENERELMPKLELKLLENGKALSIKQIGNDVDMWAKLGPFTCQEEVKLRVTLDKPYDNENSWFGIGLAFASNETSAWGIKNVLDKVY